MMDQIKGMIGGNAGNSTGGGAGFSGDMIGEAVKSAGYGFLNIVFYASLMFAIGYLVYKWFIFNKKVMIKTMRDNIVVDIKIKAARIYKEKKTGVMKMKVVGIKMLQEVPGERFRQRKGKLDFYEGCLDINGTIQWMEPRKSPDGKEIFLEPDPSDKKVWRSYEDQFLIDRFSKPSMWDKWKDIVVPLAAFILAFLITFFFFKEVNAGMQAMGSGMATQAEAFKEMARQCGSLIN